jgi:inosine-uridine nucleoside N-ribohydrolase
MKAVIYPWEIEKLKNGKSNAEKLAGGLLGYYWEKYRAGDPELKGCPIHDALCVGWLEDETLVKFGKANIQVSTDDLTRGETVCDINGRFGLPYNVFLSKSVDRDRFVDMVFESLGQSAAER